MVAVVAGLRAPDGDSPFAVGGSGLERKRLEMPETMIPGCNPRKGQSIDMVPRIRCLRG